MRHSNTRVFVMVLIVICTVAIDVAWKHYLETSARITAKYNLDNIRSCVNDIVLGDNHYDYRVISNDEIERALKVCAKKSLVTTTGDVFAYDLKTLDFVFDPSLDCYVEGGKKMAWESECSLHKDPEICKHAMTYLNSGYDSDPSQRIWWQFDDAREYLEWVVIPSEDRGFEGLKRGSNIKPHQLVVAQGAQEDELWARYRGFRAIVYGIMFLSIIINLMLSVHDNLLAERGNRRTCDGTKRNA